MARHDEAPVDSCCCSGPSRRRLGPCISLLAPLIALCVPSASAFHSAAVLRHGHGRLAPHSSSSSICRFPSQKATVSAALGLPLRARGISSTAISMKGDALAEEATAGAPSSEIYDEKEREAVSYVIETMMSTHREALQPAPQGSLPPDIFTENMQFLLNEPVYKAIMYNRLEQCGTEEELQQLEIVDEMLLDMKKRQRDSWNREKLEVIIGAALEGPTLLDEVLTDMRDSRALDDGMVDFLDALTEQAQANNMEPAGKGKKKKAAAADDGDGEGVAVGEDGEPLLVSMLRIIKDRVIAEIRTRDKPYVRMLAVLLRIDDTAEREALLRSTVLTADAAEMFEKFTLDGIQYMEQHRADWLADERVEKMKEVAQQVSVFRTKLHKMRSGSANTRGKSTGEDKEPDNE